MLTTFAAVALCVLATAGAQTTRRTTRATAQSKPTPSPTPIVVPRRPAQNATQPRATPTPARVLVVPSQNDETPPPSNYQRPTPTPTPEEPENEADVVRVTSNLVVVPVAVTDASGNAVQGLKKEDFRLEEEGRGQELAAVGTADEVPLDIAVLFDISSSVTAKNFFALQQEAAARFLRQVLKPTDRAAIITIADKPTLVQPLATADTATAKILTIPAASTSTPTAFYDSISFAAKYLDENAPGNHRRVILAISDGDDNFSSSVREQTVAEYEAERKSQEAENGGRPLGERAAARRDLQARHQRAVAGVQRSVQGADAVFYSINPGGTSVRLNEISMRAQNGMQSVADATGGTAYVPARTEELETIFRQIAAELRAQYLLQYLSNNQATAGKFLRIKVTTPARTDLRIRARQGYYKKG
ncbi:MAG: VWA domain-containing protein [Pyrinomonadaceae bacterium]